MAAWALLIAGCSSPAGPTWYGDIEPIVQVNCNGCHDPGGIGNTVFAADSASLFASTMAAKVEARTMPPWPPGPKSPPLVGARVLTSDEIDTIAQWAARGAPLGSESLHVDRPPRVSFAPGRPYDIQVMMTDTAYVPPPSSDLTDEVRCFVIDLGNADNVWATALNWVPGQIGAIHHIGGLAVDAASAAVARGFYYADGRPGYECAGSFGPGVNAVAGFSASGAGRDTGTILPASAGIFVPAGSSVILSVHYIVGNLTGPDQSGVQLWLAPPAERAGLRPTVQYQFSGPSELPCPTGVSSDPNDRCSREFGISQVKTVPADQTRGVNDYLLNRCGTSLDAYYGRLTFNQSDMSHFFIPTDCEDTIPYDGTIQVVHAHMHTRGAAATIEYMNDDLTWSTLLDIPIYQWAWEGAYSLASGVPVKAGQKIRLSCKYDNGLANQWSAVTHQPAHDGASVPPLEAPHYVVAGPERGDDMCAAFLTIERAPYKGLTWQDGCQEAQAIYRDACSDGGIDFLSGPCVGPLERLAVLLVETAPARVRDLWCGPKGAASTVGAKCGAVMSCTLACAATVGFSALSSCEAACKSNVNSYGKTIGQPADSGSPAAAWTFDALMACTTVACADKTDWKSYLSCSEAACLDLTQQCYK